MDGAMAESDDEDVAALCAASGGKRPRERRVAAGDVVRGRVIAVGATAAFVAVGGKAEATIERGEFRDPATGEVQLHEGDEIEATVVDDGTRSGSIVLKRVAGRGGHVPGELEQAFAHGIAIEGLVTGENKGGYDVQIGSVRAFCPGSQIDRRRVEGAQYVGQRLSFRITKLEAGGRNVVVSRPQLLEGAGADRWAGSSGGGRSWGSRPASPGSCTSPAWPSTAACRIRGRSCRSATPSTSRSSSSMSRSGASGSRWSRAPSRRRKRPRRRSGAIRSRCSRSRARSRASGRSAISS